ncbi:MAG: M1 family peptidase, partial [Burkholderiales bacterium]|nr:M1 family peptidase [Anaerolineae bacterium]
MIRKIILGALLLLVVGGAVFAQMGPGAMGLGDDYFPNLGNGGYDVQHYTL